MLELFRKPQIPTPEITPSPLRPHYLSYNLVNLIGQRKLNTVMMCPPSELLIKWHVSPCCEQSNVAIKSLLIKQEETHRKQLWVSKSFILLIGLWKSDFSLMSPEGRIQFKNRLTIVRHCQYFPRPSLCPECVKFFVCV